METNSKHHLAILAIYEREIDREFNNLTANLAVLDAARILLSVAPNRTHEDVFYATLTMAPHLRVQLATGLRLDL